MFMSESLDVLKLRVLLCFLNEEPKTCTVTGLAGVLGEGKQKVSRMLMALHDINQSLHYSDEIVAMSDGQVCAHGLPEKIMAPELIRRVYDVDLSIRPVDGKPFVIPV